MFLNIVLCWWILSKPLMIYLSEPKFSLKDLQGRKDYWRKEGRKAQHGSANTGFVPSVTAWMGSPHPESECVSRTPEQRPQFYDVCLFTVKFTLGSYIFSLFIFKSFGFSDKITFSFASFFPDEHIYCFNPQSFPREAGVGFGTLWGWCTICI